MGVQFERKMSGGVGRDFDGVVGRGLDGGM